MSNVTPKVNMAATLRDKLLSKAAALSSTDMMPLEWGKRFIPDYFFRQGCKFHDDIATVLHNMTRNRGQKVLVMAPRGNAKSTVCSTTVPLKAICECTERYIILIADTSTQAEKYLATIKEELTLNDTLRKHYPDVCKVGPVWNTEHIETTTGVCVEAIGKGNAVRGRKYKQYRPTLIIVDDPQGDDDMLSPSVRDKDVRWVDRSLLPAGDKETNFFFIGTNMHRECIVNNLSARPDFTVLKYAAIEQWPDNMALWDMWEQIYLGTHDKGAAALKYYTDNKVLMDAGAKVMWPEKESLYDLMCMRATSGHAAFASEKLNDPRDPSRCEFNEAWFNQDIMYSSVPTDHQLISVSYGDPAKGKETKKHDYSALISLHYDTKDKCCYVTADIERRPISDFIDALNKQFVTWHCQLIGVESNGFQSLVGEEAIAKYPLLPLVPVENYGVAKETRISRLSIWLQRGFFRFQKNCKSTMILLQQLMDHPHADHDDGSDALEGALRLLTQLVALDDSGYATVTDDDDLGENIFDNNPYLSI